MASLRLVLTVLSVQLLTVALDLVASTGVPTRGGRPIARPATLPAWVLAGNSQTGDFAFIVFESFVIAAVITAEIAAGHRCARK